MSNELRKVYDEWFGEKAWVPESQFSAEHWHWDYPDKAQRLKPRLPDDCPEPSEEMMNRAIYIVNGPIDLPEGVIDVAGWALIENKWKYEPDFMVGGKYWIGPHFCIDTQDPNALEILRLNRVDLFEDEVSEIPHIKLHEDVADVLIKQLQPLLKKRGWTPPNEHSGDWIRLVGVEFEAQDPPGTKNAYWFEISGESALIYALKYGPAAVRVRRRIKS